MAAKDDLLVHAVPSGRSISASNSTRRFGLRKAFVGGAVHRGSKLAHRVPTLGPGWSRRSRNGYKTDGDPNASDREEICGDGPFLSVPV